MSKENNDALEPEKEDAQVIENDDETTDNDTSASADDSTDNDASADEEKPSGSPKLLIAEIAIAVAAIGFIIFALISNHSGQDSVSGNVAVSDNIGSDVYDNTLPGAGIAGIDNSILYENIPALPDMAELNQMTEEEAQAAVTDGTMLLFTTEDGASIYIANYTNADYFNEKTFVSESEIEDCIKENILYEFGELTETDHTVVGENDVINANFVGKLDGVAFDNGSDDNVQITVGAGEYIPDFENGFIGMAVGETKDVPITFPENYGNTELAGKDVVFTLTVNEIIGTITYPEELTDEIVQAYFYDGSYTTVAECREYTMEFLTENKVWSLIEENYYITSIPEESVHEYYNEEMVTLEQYAAQYQMSVAEMLTYMGRSVDELKQNVITDACHTVILNSILDTIAAENEITVTDEDIEALAAQYGCPDVETLFSLIDEKSVKDYLIQDKILEYLVSLLP